MNREEWVRSELAEVVCEACGNTYAASRLRVLARRQGLYVVGLTCASCGAAAVAMVSFEQAGGAEGQAAEDGRPRRSRRAAPRAAEPALPAVELDDVVDMHRFLERFDGDFRRLFDTTHGGSSTRGRGG